MLWPTTLGAESHGEAMLLGDERSSIYDPAWTPGG